MNEAVSNDIEHLQYAYSKRTALSFVCFLLLYEICAYIANDMIMPGMIDVVHSFNASDSWVSASLTAYIFGGASLQLFLGPLSDHFGRRPVMLFGVIFFLFCTLFIAFSESIGVFIAARFFQGMGLCFISVIGYATLQEIFSELYAVRLIALMGNITILAPLIGPFLGTLIILSFSWRMVFYIIAVFALLAYIGLYFYMPETVGVKKKDGSVIDSMSLHPKIVTNNYLTLIKNIKFMSGSIATGIATTPIICWIGLSPLILMKVAHLSLFTYALLQLPVFLGSIIGNFFMRYLTYHISLSQISKIGSLFLVVTLLSAPLLYLMFPSYVTIASVISVYSMGLGIIAAPLNRLTLFSTLVSKGTASAMMSVILMLLCGIGNQTAGWLYHSKENLTFMLFCAICGTIYFFFYLFFYKAEKK